MQISIITGLITAVLFGLNVVLAKNTLKEVSSNTHTLFKYGFVALFGFLLSIFNWDLTLSWKVFYLVLIVASIRALYGHFYSYLLKEMNTALVSFVIQSHVFLVLTIELFLGLEVDGVRLIIAGLILILGVYLILQVRAYNLKLTPLNILYLLIAYVSIGIRPFFIRELMQTNSINNMTLLFLEFGVASVVLYLIYKKNIPKIDKTLFKNYSFQGILSLAGNFSSNYGVTYGIATIVSMMLSFELIIILALSYLMLNEKLSKRQLIGVFLGFLALLSLNGL